MLLIFWLLRAEFDNIRCGVSMGRIYRHGVWAEAILVGLTSAAMAVVVGSKSCNSTERDLVTAFATLVRLEVRGLVIGADGLMNDRSDQIAALALQHSILTIYQYREFANVGGLMSYGGSITEAYRRFGVYAGRILKGEKPSDLPVQQSTKVEFIINLRTAKALGVTVPTALLARADEVIE